MSGYTDESLNSVARLSRASPARCSMAWSWVSMGLAATLVTRRQLMVTREPMMGEVSMVMCTEILMPRRAPWCIRPPPVYRRSAAREPPPRAAFCMVPPYFICSSKPILFLKASCCIARRRSKALCFCATFSSIVSSKGRIRAFLDCATATGTVAPHNACYMLMV